jgi:hypothetical protein
MTAPACRVVSKPTDLRLCAALACAVALPGCDGATPNPGPTEALQVSGGQFVPGDLPGFPLATDAGSASDGGDAGPPAHLQITQLGVPQLPVVAGAATQSISGVVTEDAQSIGVRFADVGTGYWVVPVGAPDLLYPAQLDFGLRANFAPTIPPGQHKLLAVAIGNGSGPGGGPNAGVQSQGTICIQNVVPDNGHACNAAAIPPAAVISLSWDTNFDLDLHVVTPDGRDINPKTPLGGPVDGGGAPPATAPSIDRDSLGSCVADGLRREDVIFPVAPAPGLYSIYVDPFASCGQSAARFTVTVYTMAGTCPACAQQAVYTQTGELLAVQATGGATTGLFVHQQSF